MDEKIITDNVIDLDEVKPQASFKFGGKTYPMKAMTGAVSTEWARLRRELDRLTRRIEAIQKNLENPELDEKQVEVFEANIVEQEAKSRNIQAQVMGIFIEDMTPEVAGQMTDMQRAKVMARFTHEYRLAMDEIKAENPEQGEEKKP